MVYKFFDKKSSGSGIVNEPNYQLANELHKPIIRKFKKRKVYSSFRDNIWGVDLADMQSLSKYNKGIKYLLCAINLFSKYLWVFPWKDKRGISIINTFQKIISKGHKPSKIWVGQGGQFWSIKNTVPWAYANGEPITGFYDKKLLKTSQEKSRIN